MLVRRKTPRKWFSIWLTLPLLTRPRKIRSVLPLIHAVHPSDLSPITPLHPPSHSLYLSTSYLHFSLQLLLLINFQVIHNPFIPPVLLSYRSNTSPSLLCTLDQWLFIATVTIFIALLYSSCFFFPAVYKFLCGTAATEKSCHQRKRGGSQDNGPAGTETR